MTINHSQAVEFQGDVLFVSSNINQSLVKSCKSLFIMIQSEIMSLGVVLE